MPFREPLGVVPKVAVSGILGAMLAIPQKETPIISGGHFIMLGSHSTTAGKMIMIAMTTRFSPTNGRAAR